MNIKDVLYKEQTELLRDFTERKPKDKYVNFYTGKVEDNKDPEKLGRCRIRVYGIYGDEIPVIDLPWALPDFSFVGSLVCSFIVPPVGALVNVYFDNNDIYLPRYTTKVVDKNNMPSEKDTDYPDTMVFFETDEGETFRINRKQNTTFYETASNVNILVDKKGNTELNTTKSETGNLIINLKGNTLLKDDAGNSITMDTNGIIIKDKNGNKIEMSKGGVKINNSYIVKKEFLDWISQNSAALVGPCALGAPAPIFASALSPFIVSNKTPGNFKTDKGI